MANEMTSQEALMQARSSVDDIAQIKEGRTVSLAKYRNIGIMAHIDAVKHISHLLLALFLHLTSNFEGKNYYY